MADQKEPVKVEQPNVLIVEGKEEKLFFDELIEHLKLQKIQIMPIGGKDKLRSRLKALVSTPDFSKVVSLGIVRDADTDPDAAFQSVCDALRVAKLPAPDRPLVPIPGNPRVTVMVLPGDNESGMLEDLCLKSVAQDPAMPCVERYFECLQQNNILPDNMSKAKVQAFLASRPKTGLRLGEAAEKGYWPWDENIFEQVRIFLQQLYSKEDIAFKREV